MIYRMNKQLIWTVLIFTMLFLMLLYAAVPKDSKNTSVSTSIREDRTIKEDVSNDFLILPMPKPTDGETTKTKQEVNKRSGQLNDDSTITTRSSSDKDDSVRNKSSNIAKPLIKEGVDVSKVIQERDELSKIFNQRLEQHAEYVCSMKKKIKGVSSSGAFCGNTAEVSHKTDKKLSAFLCLFLKNSTVGSFGDGLGFYQKYMLENDCVPQYDSYDGTPNVANYSEGRVQFLDLSVPQYGLPMYDVVMSLEVGEHIPAAYEDIFLDNLVRYSRKKIILSWAVLGQPGHQHVNNRSPEHVVNQMKKRGFSEMPLISEQIRKNTTFWWFKKTIRYYEKDI